MKLTDLNPRWDDREEEGRRGVGLWFGCPTCEPAKRTELHIWFSNPIDGGSSKAPSPELGWTRTGETFEAMSLTPSIDCSACGHWHGFLTNGEIK